MLKRRVCSLLLIIVILLSGFVMAVNATDSGTMYECIGLDAQVSFLGNSAIIENVGSAILYETGSNMLMYAQNVDARIYPASLVKIMTALLAVEQGKLTDIVVVKEEVLSTVPSSAISVDLQVDELITLEDLLYCMMVASANDAAAVIAAHISGDVPSFVTMMNQRAADIGCSDTAFTNVHGLHNDDQYSTVRDMAKILAVAVENTAFMEVFSTIERDIPATNKSEERYLSSGNYLVNREDVQIYYDGRATGGRTGVDKNGYRCLATTASANGLNYIAIVTGSESVYEKDGYTVRVFGGYNETKKLLDLGFNGYVRGQVFLKGQSVKQESVINGACDVTLGASADVYAIVPDNTELTYQYSTKNGEIRAPIQQGESLSTVQVWCNGICIAQTDLYAMNSVAVAGTTHTILASRVHWSGVLITVICCILGAAAVIVVGVYVYKKTAAKSPRRRKQKKEKDN